MNTTQLLGYHLLYWITLWVCIQQYCYSCAFNTDVRHCFCIVPAPVRPQAFSVVFQKAVLKAEPEEGLKQRVSNLIDSITSSVFQYTTRGLFECDKLTYIAQLAFQVGRWIQFHPLHGLFLSTRLLLNGLLRRPAALFGFNQVERRCALYRKCVIVKLFLFVLCPDTPDE